MNGIEICVTSTASSFEAGDSLPPFEQGKLNQLLEHYSLNEFLQLTPAKLGELKLNPGQIKALTQPDLSAIEQVLQWQHPPNQHVIHYHPPSYPNLLKQISSCPLVLIVKGNIDLLNTPQIGIVGSRNLTITGQENAFQFAKQLATCSIYITARPP